MDNIDELTLARKAIESGVTGCYEWDERQARRVRGDSSLQGLTPEYIRRRLREFVLDGGEILQVLESRSEYRHRKYWYKAIIPEEGFPRGLFVEFELTDQDPELPCITLLNAHPERS